MMKKLFLILFCTLSILGAKAQNCLQFDHVDDYVTTTFSGVLGDTARTIEAWVNSRSRNGEQIIVAWGDESTQGGRFTFRLKEISSSKDVIRVEIKGSGLDGTINVGDSTWHHVAVTFDPLATDKYKLYVDGVLDVQGNISTTLYTNGVTPVRFGRRISATFTGYFDGKIDEVRLWNVARTQADIQANMNNEFCTMPSGMVAYYKLNQGQAGMSNPTETTAIDLVNNNNGTLQNFALTGNTSNWVTGKTLVTGSSTPGNATITACGSYTAASGSVWTTSGNYVDTISSLGGCDSILNIALTVLPNASTSFNATGCNDYTVPSGSQTYTQSGTVYDTLPSANGCDSILTINLTINTVDTAVLANGAFLTAYANGATYQWLDCDNSFAPIAGATSQTYQATANGNYAVEINDNGCIDTSGCHNVDNIGFDEFSFEKAVTVYPNPATNVVRVLVAGEHGNVNISIVNAIGEVVLSASKNSGQEIALPVDLPSGIYFVKVEADYQKVVKRITIL